eukprot:GHVP01044007.1.p1 GENE.GHVP01044007.1~~GHVP01044007.1.p1  ORF type:complete len:532 (+),score=91.60 GHVP01044007.1:431-2026(+)
MEKATASSGSVRMFVVVGVSDKGGELPESISISTDLLAKHSILAHDICGVSDAFIALRASDTVCWGNDDTCANIEATDGEKILEVYCPKHSKLFVLITENPQTALNDGNIILVGDQTTVANPPENIKAKLGTVTKEGIQQAVGNEKAIAILLWSGDVVVWGSPDAGGEPPEDMRLEFVTDIKANKIGFVTLTNSGIVYSWGSFNPDNIPQRITNREVIVTEIFADYECFVVIDSDGRIATWGLGEQSFCNERGAFSSPGFISFNSIEELVKEGVVAVEIGEKAIMAITDKDEVVVWGSESYGGSKIPETTGMWDPEDIINGSSETLSTVGAFCYQRQDGFVVAFGNREYGGMVSPIRKELSLGVRSSANTVNMFAVVNKNDQLIIWNGANFGIFEVNSTLRNKNLPMPPNRVFGGSDQQGFLVALRKSCEIGNWGDWEPCTTECGPGIQSRFAEIQAYPINDVCDISNLSEERSCMIKECPVPTTPAPGIEELTESIPVLLFGGIVIMIMLAASIFFCLKSRKQPRHMQDI